LLLPWRAFLYLLQGEALKAEVRGDLRAEPELSPLEGKLELPKHPLRIFVSCAEASGELHALNLIEAIRVRLAAEGAPPPEFSGLGGAALAEAGVAIVADPVSKAAMGFSGVFRALPFYLRLNRDAAEHLLGERIDLFLPVDSPALHVPIGHIARTAGIPVVHFVTPQYWGWAPWRVGGYRRAVDLALTILPFEPPWFERRGVRIAHVGHPILDELGDVPSAEGREAGALVLLPGSRRAVIARNLPVMLEALRAVRENHDELEVVVAQSDRRHAALIESVIGEAGAGGPVRLSVGDLDEVLSGARLAFSVSGTILLHLLAHRLPAIVLYRLEHRAAEWVGRHFLTTPHFASVNLLAGAEIYPEFSFAAASPPPELVAALGRGLQDEAWRAQSVAALEAAAARLGPPGATARAAFAALSYLSAPRSPR
jgi:lipid-A-disaccharide synthase